MNILSRSLLMIMLVVAFPLQGQAEALTTCHGLVAIESSAVERRSPAAAVVEHSQHHGQLGYNAPHSQHPEADNSDRTQTGATAFCGFCSAFCTIAIGLTQTVLQYGLDFRPPPPPQTTPSVYVEVVLDGLLRPPRS